MALGRSLALLLFTSSWPLYLRSVPQGTQSPFSAHFHETYRLGAETRRLISSLGSCDQYHSIPCSSPPSHDSCSVGYSLSCPQRPRDLHHLPAFRWANSQPLEYIVELRVDLVDLCMARHPSRRSSPSAKVVGNLVETLKLDPRRILLFPARVDGVHCQ